MHDTLEGIILLGKLFQNGRVITVAGLMPMTLRRKSKREKIKEALKERSQGVLRVAHMVAALCVMNEWKRCVVWQQRMRGGWCALCTIVRSAGSHKRKQCIRDVMVAAKAYGIWQRRKKNQRLKPPRNGYTDCSLRTLNNDSSAMQAQC